MKPTEQKRFDALYAQHLRGLKLHGYSTSTIDVYSRAVRRLTSHYDCVPDQLSVEQLEIYFAALVDSHSWGTVKVVRNGLQFFWKHVLKQDWRWLEIIKAPKIQSLPDILTPREVERLIGAARKLAEKWVVDCKHVGGGKPALQYLSRYLYRGVISENNIVANDDGRVTFKYIDSNTGQSQYRTLKGEDFLWLVLQHVLPKGFRRVRDYGFLHGNARRLLLLIQLILRQMIDPKTTRPRPVLRCPRCKVPMQFMRFIRPARALG